MLPTSEPMEPTECYVCTDSEGPLLSDVCMCKGRHIHAACQFKLVETLEKSGRCSVCQEPYRNIRVVQTRRLNKRRIVLRILVGTFVGSGCVSMAFVVHHTLLYFNIPGGDRDQTFNQTSACVSICGTSSNSSCTSLADETSVLTSQVYWSLRDIMSWMIRAGMMVSVLITSLCLLSGVYFERLTRRLAKYHERREIHFWSGDAAGTRSPASASHDEACARSEAS